MFMNNSINEIQKTNQTRVEREKDWHNQTFGSNARQKTDKFYFIFPLIRQEQNKKIAPNLHQETTVFLDYGCGNGYDLIERASKIKKGIGIDISEALINHAQKKATTENADNLEFLVMDATNTTFENNSFDIIRGQAILHHLDLKKSLKEIKRILKSDGKAFFLEPLDTNFLIKLYRKLTPEARTADEQPLRKKDIRLIKTLFPKADINYYFCLSLLAVPFRNYKIFGTILSALYAVDKIILHKYSPLKNLAWYCSIELKN